MLNQSVCARDGCLYGPIAMTLRDTGEHGGGCLAT